MLTDTRPSRYDRVGVGSRRRRTAVAIARRRAPHADHLVRPRGLPDRDRRPPDHPGPVSIARLRRIRAGGRARRPRHRQPRERPLSQPSRPDRPAVRDDPAPSSFPPGGTVFRGVEIGAVHVYESPERLAEDEVAIVSSPVRGPARRLPGRPRASPDRAGAGAAPRRRHRPGAGGRAAHDRLSRDPRRCSTPSVPGVVIPMHYKTPRIDLNIQPVERFLETPAGRPRPAAGFQLDRASPGDAAGRDDDRAARARR